MIMADPKLESLPILVVSARDKSAANYILTEILDNIDPERRSEDETFAYVWKIINKYYTADVRVLVLLDGQELDSQLIDLVQAHLIYMSEDECTGAEAVVTMKIRARAVRNAHVRVLAAAAERDELTAAAAAARLELVPLVDATDATDATDETDPTDEQGVERVRAALHAHVWPGLVRRRTHDSTDRAGLDREEDSSSSDEWSEWCAGPAPPDAFSAALSALPAAAAAARAAAAAAAEAGAAADAREERLARAELLVEAFCRALGAPLD